MSQDDPVAAVLGLVDAAGIAGRRVRLVVALLVDEAHTLASLVTGSGVDRRTVEAVLAALQPDLRSDGHGRVRIAPERIDTYRALAGPVRRDGWRWSPYDQLLAGHDELVRHLGDLVADAPAARRGLDHVAATARTIAARALWLDATFALDGATVLCVGDHDLTSLALRAVNPRIAVTVVDVDDGVLGHIDAHAGGGVRCMWGDLRFGLPDDLSGGADLVVTDPPYTAEGVRLFLTRGLQGLRDADQTRLVMAYGFGEQPTLGIKVQQAVVDLHLAVEAILPDFNRYHGAQAVGSSSDLYVLRPTPRSRRIAASPRASTSDDAVGIYTHGAQSLEGAADAGLGDLGDQVRTAATGPRGLPIAAVVGPGWSADDTGVPVLGVAALLGGAQPPAVLGRPGADTAVAVDLRADPGGWLVRVLLAVSVARLAILVPNSHPDLTDERAQRALHDLLTAKYRLRLRRSTPGPRLAIVEADRCEPDDAAGLAVRGVLDRSHGKLANTWRESLIASSGPPRLTRNEARERIRTHVGADEHLLACRAIGWPRWSQPSRAALQRAPPRAFSRTAAAASHRPCRRRPRASLRAHRRADDPGDPTRPRWPRRPCAGRGGAPSAARPTALRQRAAMPPGCRRRAAGRRGPRRPRPAAAVLPRPAPHRPAPG